MGPHAVFLVCKIHCLKMKCVYAHRCSVGTQAAWTMDPQEGNSLGAGAILVVCCCYKNYHRRRALKPDTFPILEWCTTSRHRFHQANSKGLAGLCSCPEILGENSFLCHFQLSEWTLRAPFSKIKRADWVLLTWIWLPLLHCSSSCKW